MLLFSPEAVEAAIAPGSVRLKLKKCRGLSVLSSSPVWISVWLPMPGKLLSKHLVSTLTKALGNENFPVVLISMRYWMYTYR